MGTNRSRWNILETTISYKARARLTPTLTHVVTYKLVTSGAEDDAMSDIEGNPQKIKSEVYRVQKGGLIYMKGDCASSQKYCVLLRDAAHIYCGQESTILTVSH